MIAEMCVYLRCPPSQIEAMSFRQIRAIQGEIQRQLQANSE